MITEETAYFPIFYHQYRICVPSYVVIISFVSPFGNYYDSKMVSNEGSQTSAKFLNRSSLDSWCFILLSRDIGWEGKLNSLNTCPKQPNCVLSGRFHRHICGKLRINPSESAQLSNDQIPTCRSTDRLVPMSTHAAKSNHPTRAHILSDKELDCVLE